MTDRPIQRIVLGTVQLGLPYGRMAGMSLMPTERAWAILDTAWSLGVRAFDTATAYGTAATRLHGWLDARCTLDDAEVITKIAPVPEQDFGDRGRIALLPFVGARRLSLLSHGAVGGDQMAQARAAITDPRVVLGQSVYTADEIAAAVADPRVTRVQAPGNIFDQRALVARGASRCQLDLRSVFLQGLLLGAPDAAEARVPGAGALAAAVIEAARHLGVAREALLIAALLRKARPADRVVIGVDHPAQLDSLAALGQLDPGQVGTFVRRVCEGIPGPIDPALLDPRQWTTVGAAR